MSTNPGPRPGIFVGRTSREATKEARSRASPLAKLLFMHAPVTIREASVTDIPEIVRLRRAMYEDMNYKDAHALQTMSSLTAEFLSKTIPDGSFRAWLAHDSNHIIAGGAVIITPWPSHPYDLECRRATILNVYTDPNYRRRGIARQLMQTMIDWCRQEGFARVTLHASDDGRHIYEALGFEPSNEMRLKLR